MVTATNEAFIRWLNEITIWSVGNDTFDSGECKFTDRDFSDEGNE